ncbi:MAG: hypothetical protein ACYC2H_06670 [Thermoplasmatota archaeon]
MRERTLQGALTFLGFAVSVIAVFYFAIEYIPRVSEWTQVAALILLGLCFAFLGVSLRPTSVGQPFFSGPRLQWLRPPVVLYLLAIFSGIVAEIRFLSIDAVPKPVKILVSLVLGIGLIVAVARRTTRPSPPDAGESTEEAPNTPAPPRPASSPAPRAAPASKPRASAKRTAAKPAAKKSKR